MISYIYVKHFEWFDTEKKALFGYFPPVKSVQRAKLSGGTVGIIQYNLVGDNKQDVLTFNSFSGGGDTCKYEFVEIARNNILEFDLTIEQIDQLTEWIQNKNLDIMEEQLPQSFQYEINNIHKQYIEDMSEVAEAVGELHNVNTMQFNIILELINYINATNQMEEDPARFITHGQKGLGANIAEAVRLLNQYASGPKYGEDRDQLLTAILAIMNEMERRNINELD